MLASLSPRPCTGVQGKGLSLIRLLSSGTWSLGRGAGLVMRVVRGDGDGAAVDARVAPEQRTPSWLRAAEGPWDLVAQGTCSRGRAGPAPSSGCGDPAAVPAPAPRWRCRLSQVPPSPEWRLPGQGRGREGAEGRGKERGGEGGSRRNGGED